VNKKTVNAERKRLEGELKRLWSFYLRESYAVYMLRRKLLEKQGEFLAEALSDAENVTVESFPSEGLRFPKEIYVKLVKIAPQLVDELFPKLVSEGALIRLVASFEYFVINSVKAVLDTYPDLVNDKFSRSKNPVQEQLKRLRENNLQKKLDFVAGRLGISIDVKDVKSKNLKEIIATRHIITHNRGIVDDKYRYDAGPCTRFRSGEERPIDDQYFEDSTSALNSAVVYLCLRLTEKYCGTVW